MAKPKKDLSQEKEATLMEMFDYFCSKIDFSKAYLDGTAVVCMDILFKKLGEQKEKYTL